MIHQLKREDRGHASQIELRLVAISAAQRIRTAPASARELLADEIRILRQNTNAPNSALQDLIRLSRETHPWDYLPLHRLELP